MLARSIVFGEGIVSRKCEGNQDVYEKRGKKDVLRNIFDIAGPVEQPIS